jgi:dipeptide/tripeptide permease
MSDAAPASNVPTNHPKGFYYFFWGEFAERFSYYGMRAILPLYLTTVLQFSDATATEIYSYFKAACYLLPLLGGFLADRYFGKYWTIVGFSIPYVIGQFLLCVPDQTVLLLALVLLAGGSGVIKPNISTLMGLTYDQKRPGQTALRSSAFMWFYFSINIGAMISLFAMPEIREWVKGSSGNLTLAYQVAFLFPAVFMIGALIAFAAGKKHYAVEVIDRSKRTTPEERAEQWRTLASLFGIFGLMIFFWVAYEQNDNLWVFFARDHMDRTLDVGFYQKTFAPDGFQFFNAVFVVIMAPLFAWSFSRIDPKGTRFPATTKILVGFILTAASAGIMALASMQAEGGVKVSAWWLVLAYFVLTLGEVLLYGTGLELAFTAAPASMKGFVTACFLLTNTAGNLVNSQYSKLYTEKYLTQQEFFLLTMGIVLAAAVAFYFVGISFNRAQAAKAAEG